MYITQFSLYREHDIQQLKVFCTILFGWGTGGGYIFYHLQCAFLINYICSQELKHSCNFRKKYISVRISVTKFSIWFLFVLVAIFFYKGNVGKQWKMIVPQYTCTYI